MADLLTSLAAHDDLLELISSILPLHAVGRLACSCQMLARAFGRQSNVWQHLLLSRWAVGAGGDEPWRRLQYLETHVRREMAEKSFRRGFESMAAAGMLPSLSEWEETAWALLGWMPTMERRRLAAFVCSEQQTKARLKSFLRRFSLHKTPTPEMALRRLLLLFPFLPIDAGSGADRVIGQFAYNWVDDNPEALVNLGLDDRASRKQARDVVYSLTYSIIMLNTDLNNPVIWPKMTDQEYVASCHRCDPLKQVPDEFLMHIHQRMRRSPLKITQQSAYVDTSVSSSADGETVTPAHYSIYSNARPEDEDPDVIAAQQAAVLAQARATPRVEVNWTVAYWNMVDFGRACRYRIGQAARGWPVLSRAAFVTLIVSVAAVIVAYFALGMQQPRGVLAAQE